MADRSHAQNEARSPVPLQPLTAAPWTLTYYSGVQGKVHDALNPYLQILRLQLGDEVLYHNLREVLIAAVHATVSDLNPGRFRPLLELFSGQYPRPLGFDRDGRLVMLYWDE